MKFDELLQLVEAVSKSELTELKYEKENEKVCLKKQEKEVKIQQVLPQMVSGMPMQGQADIASCGTDAFFAQTAPAAALTPETGKREEADNTKTEGHIVKSPLVGTFYAAPAEDAKAYVEVGDTVKEGQVLAIVEAMKLMNEIESEFSGKICEILVKNGEAVEYGQPLFVIR
ncbi:acetyl-CoA carboxylase biotin carboxyl carrier protein [Mediterraneibacter sp. NSJ-55]|uniref:Biotin carboxyl carrier protein of acetyl-CoA carboxylase n=1 Tax=Mediterraneibacter hominis TaxID=2763054 RepID=A0A923RS02_9FIRM|nr:acetyl-CoA carboxylase biotin carboxyl carrier protein [Mediterraneibacter hominis]MBC5688877.1 acetyl-CoA carboxylase biotin carboxyl carrier protein [Mediterraneibacter hominis]